MSAVTEELKSTADSDEQAAEGAAQAGDDAAKAVATEAEEVLKKKPAKSG